MIRQQLSTFQIACLIGNFIFSGTLISLPQIMIEVSKQNTWLVVPLTYLLTIMLIFLLCRNPEKLKKMRGLFNADKKTWLQNTFLILFFFFILFMFIRDFRAVNSFIDGVLLPDTPIEVIAILTTLTLIYITLTGVEVISRITVIHFMTISAVVIALPFMLINEIQLPNLLPIGGVNSVPEILKSSYIFFPWMMEAIIIVFLFVFFKPIEHLKKAGLIGTSVGFLLLFILIVLNITVLGVAVSSEATYPNIALIQQINLTDFLDRLDLVIEVVWIPSMLCKLSLLMFCINKLMNVFRKTDSDLSLVPLALLLGLTIHLSKNNLDSIEYSFFTWPTKGLLLESSIVTVFLLIKRKRGKGKKKAEG
ncbi:GerAB/ArcD/ProY family transporter [Robertmurraya massiliosenegalensis]|uniref:GerAB/ArcD/ProY family transporter n=1 Tax=Robertmurraya massiliosenegalensis TaxID=1287657 RepID=UPI0002D6C7E8|nr:endospore germination permease [Robertmurraya massiliosenegalensis]